ncbi:MAG: hypothetical protein U5K00_04930 [Melioribacteraceae bacterium]|nr:hypothetical protein [Melioribacteraceae bacterium]
MLHQGSSVSTNIDFLLDEFEFLCKEEKRDFLLELWERNYNEFIDDIFIKEIINKINVEMKDGEIIPQSVETILEN